MSNIKQKLAEIISLVFDPRLEIPVMLAFAVKAAYTNGAPGLMLLFLLFMDALLPFVVYLYLLKQKVISHWDIVKREERLGLYVFSSISHLGGVGLAWVFGQADLARLLLAFWFLAVMFTVVTFVWKVSMHAGVNSAFATFLIATETYKSLLLVVIVVAVGWSRLKLGRHEKAQVLVGTLLGVFGMLGGMKLVGL